LGRFGGVIALFLLLVLLTQNVAAQELSTQKAERVDYASILSQLDISEMRQTMLGIWRQGLNPKSYWTERMEGYFVRGGNIEYNLRSLANQAYLQMLKDLYLGSVDPQSVGRDVKLIRKPFLTPKELMPMLLAAGRESRTFMESLAPKNAPYLSVREAFVKIYPACRDGVWQNITPLDKPLRLFMRHPAIELIKKRLSLLGYYFTTQDDLFDGDLLNAVSDVQWNLRIKPDGEISPNGKVWGFLNVSCNERLQQMQADMEKMRWFPQYFEKRYVFVNLAMSYFILVDKSYDEPRYISFRTVNGRVARKSPTMIDEVQKVIINPYWTVPPTIFSEDKVEDLKNLTKPEIIEYFTSHKYEVWDGGFRKRIDPTTINWLAISEGRITPDIHIRQLPHLGNALGVLKFDLTNSFSIYLHDTNQRELFNEPMRQLSSGCIRLERPLDLAEFLLEDTPWDRATIESVFARPGEVILKSTELPVPKSHQTAIYTAYLTSSLSSDGVVRFVDDLYGQNAAIKRYLRALF